jgi:uncharacterized membrane protein
VAKSYVIIALILATAIVLMSICWLIKPLLSKLEISKEIIGAFITGVSVGITLSTIPGKILSAISKFLE